MTVHRADASARPPARTGLPFGLEWQLEPDSWYLDDGVLQVQAAGNTDIFVDPNGSAATLSGARAFVAVPDGRWQLTAHVTAQLCDTYDAAALMLWSDERHFAKLFFERSPQGNATVVAGVTRNVSDDANAWAVPTNTVWLRISNVAADVYAFHSSDDGAHWDLVRYFALAGEGPMHCGVEAQSPTGDGCTVTFRDLALTNTHLRDIRDGS